MNTKTAPERIAICVRYTNQDLNLTQAKYKLCYECHMEEHEASCLLKEFQDDVNKLAFLVKMIILVAIASVITLLIF